LRPRRLIPAAAAALIVLMLFISCLEWYRPASAPRDVTATQDEEDRIIISWREVPYSAGYAVYRSDTEDGDYLRIGSTAETSYVDVEVGPALVYWYIVGALPFDAGGTELRSAPVLGQSVHVFSWARRLISTGAEHVAVATDHALGGVAFVASAGSGESSVAVERYDDDTWEGFGDPVGAIDDTVAGLFDIAASDDVAYLAYADRTRSGNITVQSRANEENAEWAVLGNAGFGSAPDGRIDIEVIDGVPTVATAIDTGAFVQVYELNAGSWSAVGTFAPAPALAGAPLHLALLADGTVPLVVIAEPASVPADPPTIRIHEFSGGSWSERSSTSGSGTSDPQDVRAFSAATDANGTTYVATVDGGAGLLVKTHSAAAGWTTLSPAVTADTGTPSVGIAADDTTAYLFYRDASSLAGMVAAYDVESGSWDSLPYSDNSNAITSELNVGELTLATYANRVYAAYVDGTGFGGNAASAAVYR